MAGVPVARHAAFAHADSRLVFRRLVQRPAVTSEQLSEELAISAPEVSEILNGLVNAGLATGTKPEEKGSILFSPTIQGLQLYRECNRHR